MKSTIALVFLLQALLSHADEVHSHQVPLGYISPPVSPVSSSNADSKQPQNYLAKYGPQSDLSYTGPLSFSHLDYARCLDDPSTSYDIAIFGMPFDTTTSYRAGARFGPHGIRLGSRRQSEVWGHSLAWGMNPYEGVKVMDCGDVPLSAYDNLLALDQMEVAYDTLLSHSVSKSNWTHPKIVTLGGDHTIVLPILRSLNKFYGPVSVIHFDAHLDTGGPKRVPAPPKPDPVTHGSYFFVANEEGLMIKDTNIHAGIRQKMPGESSMKNDLDVGFVVVSAEDIDDIGVNGVIKRIRDRVGNNPVYLTLDIDTLDPSMAPATGTPEIGGWTSREVKRIIRGLSGLNFVGADLVEVAPAYDNADITAIAAADIIHDFLGAMLNSKPPGSRDERKASKAAQEL